MMAATKTLYEQGRALRQACPRASHAEWKAPSDRPTAVDLIKRSDEGRIPELVPIRHGRMLQTPFTLYRGSALAMAVDLAKTPSTGIRVQSCGDAHLGNFLCFATPERRVIFDIHDLDETAPAPWEWDVKRLAASFVLASRDNGLPERQGKDAVRACVRSYREHMAEFSEMNVLDRWYYRFEIDDLIAEMKRPAMQRRALRRLSKARSQSILEHEFPKLVENAEVGPQIKDSPPLIYHLEERGHKAFAAVVREAFESYRESLPEERRQLLDRFELKDMSVKVVGVGSVGTYCGVMLLMASEHDPLFLQIKQATESVLEPFAGKSAYANHGQRVVMGHKLMQSASDLFLGWTEGRSGRQFYIRQLRDTKIKFAIESFGPDEMTLFAKWCGATLARAHARAGEPALIAGYLGKSEKFDRALAKFAVSYADQVEQDHESARKAAEAGRLEVRLERA